MNFFEKLGLSIALVCVVPAFMFSGLAEGVATLFLIAGLMLFIAGHEIP